MFRHSGIKELVSWPRFGGCPVLQVGPDSSTDFQEVSNLETVWASSDVGTLLNVHHTNQSCLQPDVNLRIIIILEYRDRNVVFLGKLQQLNAGTLIQTYGHLNQKTHFHIITAPSEHHRGTPILSRETISRDVS